MNKAKLYSFTRSAILLVLPTVLLVSVRAAAPELFPTVESVPDYRSAYLPTAQRIADGKGLVGDDGRVFDGYPPGYACLLAALIWISRWLGAALADLIQLLNVTCFTAAAWMLYAMAAAMFGRAAAWFSFLLWVTYPPAWFAAQVALTESPFCMLSFAATLILVRLFGGSVRAVFGSLAAGVLIGLASLVRPAGIGLGLVSAMCLLGLTDWRSWRKKFLYAGLLLVGNLVTVAPWVAVVYRYNHRLIPLSTGGPGSMTDGMKFARVSSWPGIESSPNVVAVACQMQAHFSELTTPGAIFSFLADQLRDNPAGVIQLFLYKAARCWYASDSGTHDGVLLRLQLIYIVLILSSTVIVARRGRNSRRLCIIAWGFAIYFWAMTTMVLSIVRYMLPAMGLLFLLPPVLLTHSGASVKKGVLREDRGAKPLF